MRPTQPTALSRVPAASFGPNRGCRDCSSWGKKGPIASNPQPSTSTPAAKAAFCRFTASSARSSFSTEGTTLGRWGTMCACMRSEISASTPMATPRMPSGCCGRNRVIRAGKCCDASTGAYASAPVAPMRAAARSPAAATRSSTASPPSSSVSSPSSLSSSYSKHTALCCRTSVMPCDAFSNQGSMGCAPSALRRSFSAPKAAETTPLSQSSSAPNKAGPTSLRACVTSWD
mmetsp:Transcript_28426/g.76732  ORF Transcript_28426/g.76732 Transcript_28426/m.76732 type:complete len:231 (+) Transcript_28426:626-1318(+)